MKKLQNFQNSPQNKQKKLVSLISSKLSSFSWVFLSSSFSFSSFRQSKRTYQQNMIDNNHFVSFFKYKNKSILPPLV